MEKLPNHTNHTSLKLRRLGIDTQQEYVVFMVSRCHICKSEGFEALTRLEVVYKERIIIATLNVIVSGLLNEDEAGLSESAWKALDAKEGDDVIFRHVSPVESFHYVRQKMMGHPFTKNQLTDIVKDIVSRKYSNTLISSFITVCTDNLNDDEVLYLTEAMLHTGQHLHWPNKGVVVDKHCIGGVPGNRTTPIVVSICAENGLIMPKTSSRAITSPAGTADTMEVITNVMLSMDQIIDVINKQSGCFSWGGAINLSPADDILIRVERTLSLDGEGQMIASILSKKAAVGSSYVLIDIPVGPNVKVKTDHDAKRLAKRFVDIGEKLGLKIETVITDGSQPIGRGIGPTLEILDVLAVLQNTALAPLDLKEKSIQLAGQILAFSKQLSQEDGYALAKQTLESGKAFSRFKAICEAQGRFSVPNHVGYHHTIYAEQSGTIKSIHCSRIARAAKLSGAPQDKKAGVLLHKKCGELIKKGEALLTIYAESRGSLTYSCEYIQKHPDTLVITKEA